MVERYLHDLFQHTVHGCSGGESLAICADSADLEIELSLPRQKAVTFPLGQDLK